MGTKGSDLLNGFWEEGYHYYLQFDGDKLTVRNYRREVALETDISYDVRALERGERTVIALKDNVLSRTASGEPFTVIRELAYENGELKFLYYYTIMGETLYTLKKVDHGPFDHIRIRDDEFLTGLQGEWVEWRPGGKAGQVLTILGNRIRLFGDRWATFHAVSYTYDPDSVHLVPANLIDTEFAGWTSFRVYPDRLTSTMMVCDMSMPLSVFARRDRLADLDVPDAAKRPAYNTMTMHTAVPFPGIPSVQTDGGDGADVKRCPSCGYAPDGALPKFCPECGTRLRS